MTWLLIFVQIAVNDFEAEQDLSNSLIRIVDSVRCRERHLRAFSSSERVFQKTSEVFSQIVNFCIRAKLHFQQAPISTSDCAKTFSIGPY